MTENICRINMQTELGCGATVVIPAHNAARFISEAVKSVLEQRAEPKQVIVVENGSRDNTADVVSRFGRSVILIKSPIANAQAARNVGLRLAKYKYVKFLDADDRLTPNTIEQQIQQAECLATESPLSFPYGDAELISADGRHLGYRRFRPLRQGENPLGHALENAPLTSAPLHLTEMVRQVGGFDETLVREHETELFFRLLLANAAPKHFPMVVYQYRQHEDGANLMAGGVARHGALWQFQYLEERLAAAVQFYEGNTPRELLIAFGKKYWREGRAILREGYAAESEMYFQRAVELAGGRAVNGGLTYRLVSSILGPSIAERLGQTTNKVAANVGLPRKFIS